MDLIETHFSSSVRHPWELARLDVVKKLLSRHVSTASKSINMVDVGCGDVYFLSRMKKNFPQSSLYGVDRAFTEEIKTRLHKEYPDLQVDLSSHISNVPLSEINPAHLLFLLDVIEHIEDDTGFLQELMQQPYVTSETIIVITVPAFQGLFTQHDFLLGHYRRYSNASLYRSLKKGGLDVNEYGYFFTSIAVARLFEKLIEKARSKKRKQTDVGQWNKGRFLTRSFYSVLLLDFYVSRFFRKLGIRLPGLSNYAICRKRV